MDYLYIAIQHLLEYYRLYMAIDHVLELEYYRLLEYRLLLPEPNRLPIYIAVYHLLQY